MPSQTPPSSDPSSPPFFETLMNSTNRDTSPFLLTLMMLGLNPTSPRDSRDRIILINPTTQNVVIIERNSNNNSNNNNNNNTENPSSLFDSMINSLFSDKTGQPPASKASIDAMRSVEVVKDDGDEQCVVCLEDWRVGEKVKEMPCQHRFHGECIEKWLNIHGSCPVCRYEMPCDGDDGDEKMRGDGENRVVWVGFSISRGVNSESSDSLASSDQEMEELD